MKWKNIYPLFVLHLDVAPWSFMEMQYPWLNLVHYIHFVENYLGLFGVNQTLVGWLKINVTSCELIFTNYEKSFQNEVIFSSRQNGKFIFKKLFIVLCKINRTELVFLLITLRLLELITNGSLGHSNQRFRVVN